MSDLLAERMREFAKEVVAKLREHGFEAYWAGGCVRDQRLGRAPKDYDVATSARPEQVRQVFGPRRSLAIGAAFGVITVVGAKGAGQIDVATFREDVGYSDGRRPDEVVYSGPEQDARRRDFTINGLFYDPVADRIIDYVGGLDDLSAKVVRAIGDPRERFEEDKLRMLRGVRFAAKFQFELEDATRAAICDMAEQVAVVSAERIAAEMRAMLIDPERVRALGLLRDVGLFQVVLPEAAGLGGAAWESVLGVLGRLPSPSFALALAGLLHGLGEEAVHKVGLRWKLSNFELDRALWLVDHQTALHDAQTARWSSVQPILTAEGILELLDLHATLGALDRSAGADVAYCRSRLALPPEELNPAPLISGHDLIARGVPQGRLYKVILSRVREAQLDKLVHTQAEALAMVDAIVSSGRNDESSVASGQ